LVFTSVLILFLAFIVIGSITGKNELQSFFLYLFTPVYGLDQLLNNSFESPFDLNLLRPFHGVLYRLGIIDPPGSNLLPYVYTPYPINVYTIFSPYYLDLGYVGSLFAFSILGFVFGYYISKGFISSVPRDKLVGAMFYSILFLGVFYDYLLSSGFPIIIYVLSVFFFPRKREL
jgi:oligosaccharide repeat unit polymerase